AQRSGWLDRARDALAAAGESGYEPRAGRRRAADGAADRFAMTEHEQLAQLCRNLGASAAQAAVMASQLLKRADQISTERGISRERALQDLLEVVVKGRA